MSDIIERIRSFGNLEEGWHYGDGGPTRKEVIDTAVTIAEWFVDRTNVMEAFPYPGGNAITLHIYTTDNGMMEIEYYHHDGEFLLYHDDENNDNIDSDRMFGLENVRRYLEKRMFL